jgi:molybdate transport system ATP-binding protein
MKNVSVKYSGQIVLDRLNWNMRGGENWMLLGPGESGKTTLLKLILGDNLQAYANEIYLFGKRKGSGESIWDIKKQIGYVSSDLKIEYPARTNAFDIVCSGFFDTKGLYRHCNAEQRKTAEGWIKILNAENLTDKRYQHLSSGQKQLILIARAMVKSPKLLILDEPCEGLDISNREKILELAEFIGKKTDTSLIYATYSDEEALPCITHILELPNGKSHPFRRN